MPLTLFHLGPVLLAALYFDEHVDITAATIMAVLPDLGPFLVFLGLGQGPLHGPFHTIIGATLLAVITASTLFYAKDWVNTSLEPFHLAQEPDYTMLLRGGFLGAASQVILDGFLYRDMYVFFPSRANPLYGLVSVSAVVWFTILCFAGAAGLYWRRIQEKS